MTQISNSTFETLANETVPGMRRVMDEMGVSGINVTPSVRMTATLPIDGVDARVRVTVELDPEDDETEETE